MVRAIPESRLRERRRRRRAFALGLLCASTVLLCVGFVALSHVAFLRVTSVTVSGTNDGLAEQIQAFVKSKMSGAYLHLFARDNILLYPKSSITKDLSVQFPELRDVWVRTADVHHVEVSVTERRPVALWCDSGVGSQSQSQSLSVSPFLSQDTCFFLDENGLAYKAVGDTPTTNYQKYFGPAATTTLPRQYLTPDQFVSLFAFVQALGGKVPNETIAHVSVGGQGNANISFASGFEVRFLLSDNAGDVLQRFVLAQTAAPFSTHKLSDFSYLDLRFGDKIYYKLKATP
ncbi:MAG: hypothetical protein WCI89_01555 [bacterium]